MKRKPVYILCIFAAIAVLIYMTGESYYSGITKKAGLEKKEEKVYQYQYDLIVDSPDSQFWQAVYASARKTAAQNDVLLEIMGPDRGTSYDKLDYMNMSIAAKADGIILQYNGESGLEKAIDTAVENGIPVVTVMSDAVHSRRQSFVGVSDYQLGMAYGEFVSSYVDEDTEKILILQKRDIDDMNESQIYTQISNSVQKAAGNNDIQIRRDSKRTVRGQLRQPEIMISRSGEEIFCLQEPLKPRKQLRIFFSRNGTFRIFWCAWMRRPRNVPDRQCWTSTLQEKLRLSVITHRRISWQQWKKVSFP